MAGTIETLADASRAFHDALGNVEWSPISDANAALEAIGEAEEALRAMHRIAADANISATGIGMVNGCERMLADLRRWSSRWSNPLSELD
jgi:hypothetical protein